MIKPILHFYIKSFQNISSLELYFVTAIQYFKEITKIKSLTTPACVCSGIKAEEWGTFLHCKNQVRSCRASGVAPCCHRNASCRAVKEMQHSVTFSLFLERSSQIFRKFDGKSKKRPSAVQEITRWGEKSIDENVSMSEV